MTRAAAPHRERFFWSVYSACVVARAVLLATLFVAGAATRAFAQSQPVLELSTATPTVGLGDAFDVTLIAQDTEIPSFPELALPPGMAASRPSIASSRNISITNGARTDRLGIEVHWTLRAAQTGTFVVGPATVHVGDRVWTTRRLTIRVERDTPQRAPGRGPQRPSIFDPFGIFGGGGADPFADGLAQQIAEPQSDPAYELEAPFGAGVFLVAKADRASAVVGEQVTQTVLLYANARLQDPQFSDLHEAPAPQFLRQSLLDDAQPPKLLALARVGGELYRVYQLRKVALFPLTPGALRIGAMRLVMQGPRGGERASKPLDVRVVAAPLKGRPAGYAAGSVGEFTLRAEVGPRSIEEGGTFVVTATLDGQGQPPPRVLLPEGPRFEWLEPDVKDHFEANEAGRWAGRRTFTWGVRAKVAGAQPIGKMEVSCYDARLRTYAKLTADLGRVDVAPRTGPAPAADPVRRGLAELPEALGEVAEPQVLPMARRLDSWVFAVPIAVTLLLPMGALCTFLLRLVVAATVRARRKKPRFAKTLRDLQGEAKGATPVAVEALSARLVQEFASAVLKTPVRGLRDDDLGALLTERLSGNDGAQLLGLVRDARDGQFSGLTGPDEAQARFRAVVAIISKYAGKVP